MGGGGGGGGAAGKNLNQQILAEAKEDNSKEGSG